MNLFRSSNRILSTILLGATASVAAHGADATSPTLQGAWGLFERLENEIESALGPSGAFFFYILCIAVPIVASFALVCGMWALWARRSMRRTLLARQKEIRSALEAGGQYLWEFDLNGNHTLTVPRLHFDLGYGRADGPLTISEVKPLTNSDDHSQLLQSLELARRDRQNGRLSADLRLWSKERKDYIWYHAKGRIVERDAQGEPVRLIGVLWDADQIKREKLAQTRQTERLIDSNHQLEQFAYTVSNDLQEPLRSNRGLLRLLREHHIQELSPKGQEYALRALSAAERMDMLLDHLYDSARISNRNPHRGKVDSTRIVQGVVEHLHDLIERTGAQINIQALPAVYGQEMQISRLFQNALTLAIGNVIHPAMPIIEVYGKREDEQMIRISICDNGRYRSEDPHTSHPVVATALAKGRRNHSGIAMSISKRIVESHGGRLWLEAADPDGSILHFTLPAPREDTKLFKD